MADEHPCCFVEADGRPCVREAEWAVVRDNGDPYDITEACSEHVAEMLDSDCTNTVTWIGR